MKRTIQYLIIVVTIVCIAIYFYLFRSNVAQESSLYIPTNATFIQVIDSLSINNILKDINSFNSLAIKMNYNKSVKPGRYIISSNFNNYELIKKLRAGNQDAIKLTINNVNSIEKLAKKVSTKLEVDSATLMQTILQQTKLENGYTVDNILTLFISNTYELYWNTSSSSFLERMQNEYDRFWSEKRKQQAKAIGLTPTEVTILASIVQKESNHYDEYSTIAGVYLNRIQKGMKLQADPTVLFAKQQLGLANRVYLRDTKIAHPYNTYHIFGLPPGPICLPEIKSIDLCLTPEQHQYLYFCAKEDFSGYHNFAASWQEHELNAKKYQEALNKNNIK